MRMTRCSISQRRTRSVMLRRRSMSCLRKVLFCSDLLSIMPPMKLPRILTLIALAVVLNVQAQPKADDLIVEMNHAFRQGNRARLAQLLPQVRGHPLEPWAAYWELKNRLETAQPQEV